MSQQYTPRNTADDAAPEHRITLDSRASLTLDGVTDVVSFDENAALIRTSMGLLSVDGEGLHVTALDLDAGQIILDGRVNALIYLDDSEKPRRLFARHSR